MADAKKASNNTYLLEVGTEELPVGFLKTAPTEIKEKTRAALQEAGVDFGEIEVLATPRRLALMIEGLPDKQPDREELLKGPPVRVGLDENGKPTKAAEGFAKKSGINVSDLETKTIDGADYLTVLQQIKGRDVKTLLADVLPELILSLNGPRFMRWADYDVTFPRPVQWVLSLWNAEHLPVTVAHIKSSTITRGHRSLSSQKDAIAVPSVQDYATVLEKEGKVIVSQQKRREQIWQQLQEMAVKHNGSVHPREALLDEVTMLVEWPSIVLGQFDKKYLDIPDEVIVTVMANHQRYFPLHTKDGSLMPNFMTVSNGSENAADNIARGNEKVVVARLEDGRFFYMDDQKKKLEERIESLKGITFQKGLGTLWDKVQRLEGLAASIASTSGGFCDEAVAQRAARLVKADLVTSMVFEFPELQGVMGQKYAHLSGEDEAISTAIYEHYLPRFMGDDVAKTPAGIVSSIADKVDTMVAVFAQEKAKMPTGSRDPLGLRRMAIGVIVTLFENNLSWDLKSLMAQSYDQLAKQLGDAGHLKSKADTLWLLEEFVLQRLKVNLLERDIRHDIIDAVLSASEPLTDLPATMVRIDALKDLVQDSEALNAVYEPANRVGRILGEGYLPEATLSDVSASLFKEPTEKALFEALSNFKDSGTTTDMPAYIKQLVSLSVPVTAFFEDVMVNDKDAEVKKNRYNLLSVLHSNYLAVARFGQLVMS